MNKLNALTISLLAIGLGIIVLVIVFNWWQERKLRKAAVKQFAMMQDDVLMNALDEPLPFDASTKIKDVVSKHNSDEIQLPDEVEFKIDLDKFEHESLNELVAPKASFEEASMKADPREQEPPASGDEEKYTAPEQVKHSDIESVQNHNLPLAISKEVDLTAVLFLTSPANGARLRQFLINLLNLDKPAFAYGLNESEVWLPLTREQEAINFNQVAYSLQLADRAGAVSNDTLQRFQQMVADIAYELSAQVEWVGMQEPLVFAKNLDAFCLEVDKTIGFHIINGGGGRFTGTKFKGLAEANGLVLKGDGAFYSTSSKGQTLFKIINMENNPFNHEMLKSVALKGVTFQLEIALTEHCTETFNVMVNMAKSMASSLSATLVDDHQRELTDAKIEKIRQQLKLIQVQMTVKGIPPGSEVAHRLFS